MIFVWILLVSLCEPNMKACDSERLARFKTSEACESYASLLKSEMTTRGRAGAVNCFDEPVITPSRDSMRHTYDLGGRDT